MSKKNKTVQTGVDPSRFSTAEGIEHWESLFDCGVISIGEYQKKIRGNIVPGYEEYENEFRPKNLGEIFQYLPVERDRDFNDVRGALDNLDNEYS